MRMYCVFCNIVAGTEPARIHYQDDDVIVFDNRLRWAPTMILVMPKKHMTQAEMWNTYMHKVGPVAVEMGTRMCPSGYRILSNFGRDAMQSQDHAHLHLLGGTHLGPYA